MKVNQPGDPCNNQQEGIKKLLDELEDGIDLTLDQKEDSDGQPDAEGDFPFVSTSFAALQNDDSESSAEDRSSDRP